ncbi:41540_t:CDS:2, partial [Gigaspora margarita]
MKRYRECEQFARKIVDNMNDIQTRLIGMSPNSAIKLEQVYSKPSTKYYRPIENNPFERRRITDPVWSPSLHKIQKIVVGKNLPIPILYYLDETGSQCPFVREKLMHIKKEPILPP